MEKHEIRLRRPPQDDVKPEDFERVEVGDRGDEGRLRAAVLPAGENPERMIVRIDE